MEVTKERFAVEYEKRLKASGYGWVENADKLARFMAALRNTIRGTSRYGAWAHDGPITAATWRHLGLPGKPSLKGLRALPDPEPMEVANAQAAHRS